MSKSGLASAFNFNVPIQPSGSRRAADQKTIDLLMKDEAGFLKLAEFIRKTAGMNFEPNSKNKVLLSTRLAHLVQRHGLSGYSGIVAKASKEPAFNTEILECLTTNTTYFFREPIHFDILKKEVPNLLKSKFRRGIDFRIWCGAASTGQEPWTILISLLEVPELRNVPITFLATDIDNEVLKTAARAVYRQDQMRGLNPHQIEKYFDCQTLIERGQQVNWYRIKLDHIKKIQFQRLNLMDPFPFHQPFDVVFLRNVLIYFDRPTIHQITAKLAQVIRPEGMLFFGLSEAGAMNNPHFKSLSPSAFRRLVGGSK